MQAVYDGLANAQPQTGTLRKAVFFVEAFEDMFLGVFGDTASRVFDKDGGISFPVRDVAEGDAARYREFLVKNFERIAGKSQSHPDHDP